MQRTQLSDRERRRRSRLAQIIHEARFLRGTLSLRNVHCGKPGCHCARGEPHACLYLVRRQGGKLRQLFVPREWERRIREAVKNHQEMEQLIEELSDLEWQRLKERRSKIVLRRLIRYTEKIFHLSSEVIDGVTDHRSLPRICTSLVVKAVLAVYWSRLGSLNALEMTRGAKFWKAWLGYPLCSADSLGRIVASVDADTLRQGIHHVYDRLKRNKALPDLHGLGVAVLDGHETSASYRRCCAGCLKRTTASGETQFYHRNVTLMLLCGSPPDRPAVRLLLDLEPQRAGEGELVTALRLLERVLAAYPRAFEGHAHRFRDTFSVELLLAGVPIERVAILLGHQSVRITEKHYAPWVRARQEQLEADVRRTWQTHESQQGVHGGYTENDARVIRFKSRRKNCGGGGSRTPVRKALRTEAYMLISIRCATRPVRADRAFASGAWNEQDAQPTSPMDLARALRTERPRPAHCVTPLTGPVSEARGSVRLIN